MNKYSAVSRSMYNKGPIAPSLTPSFELLERTPPILKHSEYIPLSKTESKGLSDLSKCRNKVVNSLPSLTLSLCSSQSIELKTQMKSKNEYTKLIDQLEAVISTKTSQKPITLEERFPTDKFTEEGKFQYFRVNCLGKKCPLKVKVSKLYGMLHVYVAKNKSEPSVEDICIKKDIIKVSDISKTFKTEFVGIAIRAVTDSKYKITIKFGEIVPEASSLKKSDSSRLFQSRKTLSTKGKNFILLNKNAGALKEMETFKKWEDRRKVAVQNKIKHIQLKKERSWELINRNTIIRKNLVKENEKKELEMKEKSKQKKWISYIFLANLIDHIRDLIKQRREKRLRMLVVSQMIIRVQKRFRRVFTDVKLTAMARCRDSLILFKANYTISYQSIVHFTRDSRFACMPLHKMMKLKQSIELIQRQWRTYAKKHHQRWEELLIFWERRVDKLRMKMRKLKFKKTKRDQILRDFFAQKKKEYLLRVKEYIENIPDEYFPSFVFMPTETELASLFKKLRKN